MKRSALALVLLSFPFFLNAQLFPARDWLDYNETTGKFRLKSEPTLRAFPKSSKPAEWGIYLWEFGDGHFSFEKEPTHHYSGSGTRTVRLHLTPFYAANGPESFREQISPKGRRTSPPTYDLHGKKVHLETNVGPYVVPGQPVQVAAHYEAPSGYRGAGGGYLFFFYNKKKELNISFPPFEITGERTHYQEEGIAEALVLSTITSKLPTGRQAAAIQQANAYGSVAAYRIDDIEAGEQQRLFFTLYASSRLSSQQDKNRKLSIGLMWVPDEGSFKADNFFTEYGMQILQVYDPNRIQVEPRRAWYHKNFPKVLRYHIDFQNKAEGTVQVLKVDIPVEEGFRLHTAKVLDADPRVGPCLPGYKGDTLVCLKLDTIRGNYQDTLRFTFHNIGLEGKASKKLFQNKQPTKGSIDFSIEAAGPRRGANRMNAFITFNDVKPVETRNATTRWRLRTLMLRPGYSLSPSAKGFSDEASGFTERLNIGIGIQDAPIKTGLALGVELGYAGFQLSRETRDFISPSGTLPPEAMLVTEEKARLHFLEAKAWGGYQFHGIVRGFGGLGLAVPASGTVEATGRVVSPDGNFTLLQNKSSSTFGLFQSNEPLTIFEAESELRNSVGLSWQIGLEVGLLDYASIGISQEMRFFPKFYHDECARISSWNIFLRFNTFNIGGLHR